MASPLRAHAIAAHEAGLCVVPPAKDGTKRPAGAWQQFQTMPPTRTQIDNWYADPDQTGIGYVCGAASRGLEALQFNTSEALSDFERLVSDHGLGPLWQRVKGSYCEQVPGEGTQVFWQTDVSERNQRLAGRRTAHQRVQVLIETRGEGSYVVAAPSHGSVHPTGDPYELINGGVSTIATVTADERESLLELARMLDETGPGDERPIDRFGLCLEGKRAGDVTAAASLVSKGTSMVDARVKPSSTPDSPDPRIVKATGPRLIIRSLSDIQPRAIDWLWLKWLARGKLHLLGGMAGDGKSTLAAMIAAIGSRGGTWPDGAAAPRFRTLFLLGEDSLADTLRPRLDLHEADVSQILAVETVLEKDGRERFFNIEKHLPLLEEKVAEHQFDLVVIDPLTTIMGGRDRNAEGDVRDALTPLIRLADRLDVAILGIVHVGKPTGTQRVAAQRILGATAFVAQARVVWQTAPAGDGTMALGVTKANLSQKPPTLLWERQEDGPVIWHGASDKTIDELMDGSGRRTPGEDAEGFLRGFLADGARPVTEVYAAAKALGISERTVDRAKAKLGVRARKGNGPNAPWSWHLSDGTSKGLAVSSDDALDDKGANSI